MFVVDRRNVQQLYPEVMHQLTVNGVKRESRNGPVTMFPEPTTFVFREPRERVVFWAERDANPFFHFFESLWMLAGRNDVAYPAQFAANIRNYSDNSKTFHGAYGHRWRKWFERDQLSIIIDELRANRDNRRCYLQMWDATADLGLEGKDFPCNLGATLQVNHRGSLDMTVHNRSNDIVWGALGANAVHFSYLQEYIAAFVGVPVGSYWQVSSNMHAYDATFDKVRGLGDYADTDIHRASDYDGYLHKMHEPFPLVNGTDMTIWNQDLQIFLSEGPIIGFREKFFRQVATPLLQAHRAYKSKDDEDRFAKALEILDQCRATDWRRAAKDWIVRRSQAAQDGPSH